MVKRTAYANQCVQTLAGWINMNQETCNLQDTTISVKTVVVSVIIASITFPPLKYTDIEETKYSSKVKTRAISYQFIYDPYNIDISESKILKKFTRLILCFCSCPIKLLGANCYKQAIMVTRQNRKHNIFYLLFDFLFFAI